VTDFDRDPEALAWARRKIQNEIDRADKFVADAKRARNEQAERTWRVIGNHLRRSFIGGTGCVIAAFDERRPDHLALLDTATPRSTEETP
jgi:hypothetical protein